MKKISYLIFAVLFIFAFSCKETVKNTDPATDDDDDDDTSADATGISCGEASVISGSGSCDGLTCTFDNASSSYSVKISFSGVSSARSILKNKGEDSTLSISNATNSDYFTLSGTTPTKGDSSTATVLVRNFSKCKSSQSASKCNVSGYDTAPSGADDSWDQSCEVTIQTSENATSINELKTKYLSLGCNIIGLLDEEVKSICNDIKETIEEFSNAFNED